MRSTACSRIALGGATLTSALLLVAWVSRRRRSAASGRQCVKLIYLNIRGLAEPIRLAFFVAGIEFDDLRVSYEGVARLREAGFVPFGQVPALVIQDDGDDSCEVFAQSQALLRWVGRKAGLSPPLEREQLYVDQVEEAINDMKKVLNPGYYRAVLGRCPTSGEPLLPLTPDQFSATIKALNEVVLPARLQQLERLLTRDPCSERGPFLCGENLTVADLNLYVFASGIREGDGVPEGISNALLDGGALPTINRIADAVAKHPKVVEWNGRVTGPVMSPAEVEELIGAREGGVGIKER